MALWNLTLENGMRTQVLANHIRDACLGWEGVVEVTRVADDPCLTMDGVERARQAFDSPGRWALCRHGDCKVQAVIQVMWWIRDGHPTINVVCRMHLEELSRRVSPEMEVGHSFWALMPVPRETVRQTGLSRR